MCHLCRGHPLTRCHFPRDQSLNRSPVRAQHRLQALSQLPHPVQHRPMAVQPVHPSVAGRGAGPQRATHRPTGGTGGTSMPPTTWILKIDSNLVAVDKSATAISSLASHRAPAMSKSTPIEASFAPRLSRVSASYSAIARMLFVPRPVWHWAVRVHRQTLPSSCLS